MTRYKIGGSQGLYQPDSNDRVLANKLGITNTTDIDEAELVLLEKLYEDILLHPFREGNGRLSRLLADVMVVQSGREPLDYSSWDENKAEYILAIQQGVAMNYEPMKKWVARALVNS